MTDHAVLIVGAGPTGLMLAGELALAGIGVALIERRADQHLAGSRAGGLQARTIEVLDQRGIADRFLAAGQTAQVAGFAWIPLDISDFPTRHNYGLALWQNHIERLLAEWVDALKVPVYHGRDVTGVSQDETGAELTFADGPPMRAGYIVGCDGGRSVIRKGAGIAFPGWDPTVSNLISEVELTEDAAWGLRQDALGVHSLSKMEDSNIVRVLVTERDATRTGEATLADLSAALIAVYGTDYGAHSPVWISRFNDAARQAETYRQGRILLAGDAAHIHYPTGGQGLNLGVQDAVNLGWKLAQVVKGTSPDALLDSYQAERHPLAARVLKDTLAQVALLHRPDDRTKALHDVVRGLLALDQPRKVYAGAMSGLDIHYDLGPGHPLLGRRMPDLDLETGEGATTVYALLHAGRPLLLNLGQPGDLGSVPSPDPVQRVDARYPGPWTLPVIGDVSVPTAVLIRPDGYVAWVGEGSDHGLAEALTIWFGAPAPS